jgi:hypothetical protein
VNLNEFKAWFEGFGENLEGPPDKRQWARIKEKIERIADAPPVTQHVFHDHYYRPWQRWFENPHYVPIVFPTVTYTSTCVGMASDMSVLQAQNTVAAPSSFDAMPTSIYNTEIAAQFDSAAAFRELGRAEFRSIR